MIYKALELIYYLLGLYINNLINNGENVRHLSIESSISCYSGTHFLFIEDGKEGRGDRRTFWEATFINCLFSMKPGRVVILLAGRHAGKKAIIVRQHDDGKKVSTTSAYN